MATSDILICNQALARVGSRSTIAALTENSKEAKACNLVFAQTRDEVMSMAHWNFAKKTAVLALLKSAPGTPSNPVAATAWSSAYPAPPWLYEYAYPQDCLMVRYIVPQIDTGVIGVPLTSNLNSTYPYVMSPWNTVRFETATDTDDQGSQINVILTSMYQAIGCYTMRITNPNLFSDNFTQALICALAAKLAQPLSGDRALRNEMFELANRQIIQARASDGNEGLTIIDYEASWITARESVGPWSGTGYFMAPYAPLFPVGI